MRRECRERFPSHPFSRKPLVSDPGMHHGTCDTHVTWCMSGSLTRVGGENVPGIPSACATRNFTYLARGPWSHWCNYLSMPCICICSRQNHPELASRCWIHYGKNKLLYPKPMIDHYRKKRCHGSKYICSQDPYRKESQSSYRIAYIIAMA